MFAFCWQTFKKLFLVFLRIGPLSGRPDDLWTSSLVEKFHAFHNLFPCCLVGWINWTLSRSLNSLNGSLFSSKPTYFSTSLFFTGMFCLPFVFVFFFKSRHVQRTSPFILLYVPSRSEFELYFSSSSFLTSHFSRHRFLSTFDWDYSRDVSALRRPLYKLNLIH